VIVDSTAIHTEAWIAYLREYGISADNLSARMLGRHNGELVRDLFGSQPLTDEDVFRHGSRKEAMYREIIRPVLHDKLVPGVLDFLKRYSHWPMGVATNAEPANVHFVLEAASLFPYFRAVVDGSQVERPKPHPDVFLKAAALLGHAPPDCVVFEDSLTGIEAARRSGARVVGLTTTMAEFPDVDLTIRDFLDPKLDPWLQALPVSR
jgi:beta-phosphoglucomutase